MKKTNKRPVWVESILPDGWVRRIFICPNRAQCLAIVTHYVKFCGTSGRVVHHDITERGVVIRFSQFPNCEITGEKPAC